MAVGNGNQVLKLLMVPFSSIEVTKEILLNESELEFHFVRASGPGGQNVKMLWTTTSRFLDNAN